MKIFLVFCPGWEVEEKLLINCIEMLRIRNVAQAKDKQVCSSATSLRPSSCLSLCVRNRCSVNSRRWRGDRNWVLLPSRLLLLLLLMLPQLNLFQHVLLQQWISL